MILGVSLIVDDLHKGQKLVCRYPDTLPDALADAALKSGANNFNQNRITPAQAIAKHYRSYLNFNQDNFAKLFRPKAGLNNKVFDLIIDDLQYIAYPCPCRGVALSRNDHEDGSNYNHGSLSGTLATGQSTGAGEGLSVSNINAVGNASIHDSNITLYTLVIAKIRDSTMRKIIESNCIRGDTQCFADTIREYVSINSRGKVREWSSVWTGGPPGADPLAIAMGLRQNFQDFLTYESICKVVTAYSQALLLAEKSQSYVSRQVAHLFEFKDPKKHRNGNSTLDSEKETAFVLPDKKGSSTHAIGAHVVSSTEQSNKSEGEMVTRRTEDPMGVRSAAAGESHFSPMKDQNKKEPEVFGLVNDASAVTNSIIENNSNAMHPPSVQTAELAVSIDRSKSGRIDEVRSLEHERGDRSLSSTHPVSLSDDHGKDSVAIHPADGFGTVRTITAINGELHTERSKIAADTVDLNSPRLFSNLQKDESINANHSLNKGFNVLETANRTQINERAENAAVPAVHIQGRETEPKNLHRVVFDDDYAGNSVVSPLRSKPKVLLSTDDEYYSKIANNKTPDPPVTVAVSVGSTAHAQQHEIQMITVTGSLSYVFNSSNMDCQGNSASTFINGGSTQAGTTIPRGGAISSVHGGLVSHDKPDSITSSIDDLLLRSSLLNEIKCLYHGLVGGHSIVMRVNRTIALHIPLRSSKLSGNLNNKGSALRQKKMDIYPLPDNPCDFLALLALGELDELLDFLRRTDAGAPNPVSLAVLKTCTPTISIAELALAVDMTCEECWEMALHLQTWGLACIIPLLTAQSSLYVHPLAPLDDTSSVSVSFAAAFLGPSQSKKDYTGEDVHYLEGLKSAAHTGAYSLPCFLAPFDGRRTLTECISLLPTPLQPYALDAIVWLLRRRMLVNPVPFHAPEEEAAARMLRKTYPLV